MNRRMAFRLWVDDWEGGTSYMTNEELGVYLRLLIYQFRNGSIPPAIFNRISHGLTTVEQVKDKFQIIDGNYVQHRMASVRQDSIEYAEKQSIKGKKSAQQRFNRSSTSVEPYGSGSGSGSGYDVGSRGIGGMGEKGNEVYVAEPFPTFNDAWEAYQHKVGRKAAETAWKRLKQHEREAAYTKIPLYVQSLSDRKYQAHLSTWLNGRRWEDEYSPIKKPLSRTFRDEQDLANFLAIRPDN